MLKNRYYLPLLISLSSLLSGTAAVAQYTAPRLSIHLTNPLSLASKAGFKLQYRLNQDHSALVGYRNYYGYFPGYQVFGEYHHYYRTWNRWESFYYGKVGVGHATYDPKHYLAGWDKPYNDPGGYFFVGAGMGKRLNLDPFFMEFNFGLKYSHLLEVTDNINSNYFYTTGPGSLIDCSFTFGIQFFNEERNMYRHARAPRTGL